MEIFHRRIQTFVTKLLAGMMWPDMVRPVSCYPVTDGVPRDLLVFGNGNVSTLDYPVKERVA